MSGLWVWLAACVKPGSPLAHAAVDPGACGAVFPLDERLIADAAPRAVVGVPDLRVGHLSPLRDAAPDEIPPMGAVLFFRGAEGWVARSPSEPEALVGLFLEGDRVFVITHGQIEGPHPAWTVWVTDLDGASHACSVLPFPVDLNQPSYLMEWLSVVSLERSPSGRLVLVGRTEADREGLPPFHVYESADEGRHWSMPRGRNDLPEAGRPVPVALTEEAPEADPVFVPAP